jgi:exodeoxyribonuclease VII small subunit
VTTESLGYEKAREELADVVRRLEAGGLSLEESLALWERADVCAQWLEGARRRLDAALGPGDRPDLPAPDQPSR